MNLIKSIKALLVGCLVFVSNLALAQNAYIKTEVVKVANATTDAQVDALTISGKQTSYVYLNGMGTPSQKVAYEEATNSLDIVHIVQYDQSGGKSIRYLPYVDHNSANPMGSYRTTALADEQNYYSTNNTTGNLNKVANDPLPFSQELFENSPLHRLLASGTDGLGFQPNTQDNNSHYASVTYRNNVAGDNVMTSPTSSNTSFYPANALLVTDAKDADGVETLTFNSTSGRTLLKRQLSGQTPEQYYDTYYLYSANGSVSFIIPPKASNLIATGAYTNINAAPLSNLIYAYTYDDNGRIITRKIPNSGTINIVYDPMNRPILIQDADKAATNVNQWYYIKYDAENRAISQGIYTDAANQGLTNMQKFVTNNYGTNYYESRSSNGTNGYYTNLVFPTNGTPLAFSYYDNYDILQNGSPLYSYIPQGFVDGSGQNIESAATPYTQGMLTMVASHTVTSGTTNMWLSKVFFYDKHKNLIQVRSNNQLNFQQGVLTDTRTTAPDFTGKPLQTKIIKVTGTGASNTLTVLSKYTYDNHNASLQTITQQYNNQAPVTIANYAYNEIGQVVTKQLGYNASTAGFLQTLDYRYNIRGQLLTINNSTLTNDGGVTNNDSNDLFGMTYLYDATDPELANDLPSFTGKISAVKWSYKYNNGASTSNERSYVYRYDQLGQLNKALYAERAPNSSSTTPFNKNLDGFDETGITYDDDGNIKSLLRNASTTNGTGGTPLDNLTYSYDPNDPDRLYQVADQVTTTSSSGFNNIGNVAQTKYFQYDADGNLVQDPYKNISISYNQVNKIDVITAPGINNSTINYTYNASGDVLKKQIYQNGVLQAALSTDYLDEFVYINGVISYFKMPEGRVINSSGTFIPEYIIADQQGNSRLSFQDNGSGIPVIIQENSFYGFGEVMPGSLVSQPPVATANNNIYNNGSEWQNVFGNLPDYYQSGHRDYDPELGRFISVDPISELSSSLSNYHYAMNNPIMNNDPTGQCGEDDGPGWQDPGVDDDFGGQNEPTNVDTGGGGGGDPSVDYSGDNVPDSPTSDGGEYNNDSDGNSDVDNTSNSNPPGNLGLTYTKVTVTKTTYYNNGDGNIKFSYSSYTYYRYQINSPVMGLDPSSLTMPEQIQGTIPNVDLTSGPSSDQGGNTQGEGNAAPPESGGEGEGDNDLGYTILGYTNDAVHDLAEDFEETKGEYSELGAKVAAGAEGLSYILDANEIFQGYAKDNYHDGYNTEEAIRKVEGETVGATYGAVVGSAVVGYGLGAFVGFLTDGVLAVPAYELGTWIGGIVGGGIGSYVGGQLAE